MEKLIQLVVGVGLLFVFGWGVWVFIFG